MTTPSATELKALKQGIVRRISLGLNLLTLYPPIHPEVKAGIHNLMLHLEPFFSIEKELWIGIEPKGWVIQGVDLSKENIQFGATARELHRRGVSAFVVYPGVTEVTLLNFFRIAALPVAEVESRGGLIKIASEFSLPFINLFALDYEKLFSEESSTEDDQLFEENKWKNLIDRFITAGGNILSSESTGPRFQTAEELALLLNRIYKKGGLEETEKMISFLKFLGTACLTEGNQKKPKIEKFCQLISQLNPDIVNKTVSSINRSEKQFDQFDDRLLQTFNLFLDSSSRKDEQQIFEDNKETESSFQEAHLLHDIFQKRSKGIAFSEAYKGSITQMIERMEPLITRDADARSDQKKYESELQPVILSHHVFRVILDLLELENNPVDYMKLISRLPPYFERVFQSRNLDLIYEAFSFLDRHSALKEDDLIRSSADQTLNLVFSGAVVLELTEKYLKENNKESLILEKLLLRLNRSMVITQIRLFGSTLTDEETKGRLFSLLSKLMYSNIPLLEADIKNPDSNVVKDAIRIMRCMPNESCADMLASLLNHAEAEIRHQALDALMNHGTQRSLEYLLPLLKLSNKDLFSKAVKSIACYAKMPILQKVKSFLISQDMFERNYDKKMDIIAALGDQRNIHAVALLTDVFNHTPFFREKKNTAFCAAILNALAKIGTNDALIALSSLSKSGSTVLQLTGNILLENRKTPSP
ncbi:MAG: HEAT repeat domain-containing protein [Candidatus Aureabacteria bacterium]|nr:HEAT repeat domain-containing protein [Candidatus Auribacterota bacterium]